jgi:uncharacterized protein YjbI with pentapeptide repeats
LTPNQYETAALLRRPQFWRLPSPVTTIRRLAGRERFRRERSIDLDAAHVGRAAKPGGHRMLITSPEVAAVAAALGGATGQYTAGEAADQLVKLLTNPAYRAHGPEALSLMCAILSDPTLYTSAVTERVHQRLAETAVSVLAETRVYGVRLPGANLRGVLLTGAHLTGAELVGANLQDCNLFGADLSGANLTDVETGSGTRFVGVTALGARFVTAYLRGCDFESADLRGADFTAARLFNANLSDTTMGGANLTGAELATATIYSLDWRGVNLSAAKLDDALLASNKRGALLDLRGANLAGASLYRARLMQVDLRGANLTGADFTHAELTDVNLAGAITEGMTIGRVKTSEVYGLPD